MGSTGNHYVGRQAPVLSECAFPHYPSSIVARCDNSHFKVVLGPSASACEGSVGDQCYWALDARYQSRGRFILIVQLNLYPPHVCICNESDGKTPCLDKWPKT